MSSSARFRKQKKGQGSIYLILSLLLFIIISAAFAAWSAKVSSLSAEDREKFTLSLKARRIANLFDLVERNQVGIEIETSDNISFEKSVQVCDKTCVLIESLPPDQFSIKQYPQGIRIEK